MQPDIEQLIRSARPEVPAQARARTLEHVESEGAVGSTPAFVRLPASRVFMRVAAMVILALGAGVVAAMLSAPKPAGDSAAANLEARLAQARERIDRIEQDSPANRVARLSDEVAALETERKQEQQAFEQAVLAAVNEYHETEMLEWRDRHLQHVREQQAVQREATIERLRKEAGLSADQEKEVRALLVSTDKQAEALISSFYTRRHGHGDPNLRRKFEKLAGDADRKLNALLDAQQKNKIDEPAGIVSASPDDWAPSDEFHDGTDMDVYTNWITVTRD